MKREIPDKIIWLGYKQQLKELYDLLKIHDYIKSDKDLFLSHFQKRTIRVQLGVEGLKHMKPYKDSEIYSPKIEWNDSKKNNGKYLISVLINILDKKEFIFLPKGIEIHKISSEHFKGIPKNVRQKYNKKKKSLPTTTLEKLINKLFPQDALTLRESESRPNTKPDENKLFYKNRNNHSEFDTLSNLGFDVEKLFNPKP